MAIPPTPPEPNVNLASKKMCDRWKESIQLPLSGQLQSFKKLLPLPEWTKAAMPKNLSPSPARNVMAPQIAANILRDFKKGKSLE